MNPYGAVAQLVERIAGSDEVRGSIPLSSTRKTIGNPVVFSFLEPG